MQIDSSTDREKIIRALRLLAAQNELAAETPLSLDFSIREWLRADAAAIRELLARINI